MTSCWSIEFYLKINFVWNFEGISLLLTASSVIYSYLVLAMSSSSLFQFLLFHLWQFFFLVVSSVSRKSDISSVFWHRNISIHCVWHLLSSFKLEFYISLFWGISWVVVSSSLFPWYLCLKFQLFFFNFYNFWIGTVAFFSTLTFHLCLYAFPLVEIFSTLFSKTSMEFLHLFSCFSL